MRHSTRLLLMVLAACVCSLAHAGQIPPDKSDPRDILAKWRTAVHVRPKPSASGIERIVTSNEDGIRTEVVERITPNGDYRATINREYDTSEVVVTKQDAWRRDWNGFVRPIEGRELGRLQTDISELRAVLFGPPANSKYAVVDDTDQSIEILRMFVSPADTLDWYLDRKSGLPAKSVKSGDDTRITTTYENWQDSAGLVAPLLGSVTETDRPDYQWQTKSLRSRIDFSCHEFSDLVPGPSDTRVSTPALPIPFNFENDHIIFKVSLNGRKETWFLFDTGADEEVINQKRLAQFGLEPYGKTATEGGGGSAEFSYARHATFTLPGIEIRDQHVAILDESGLERAYGMEIGGILGYDFISRFVVEVDYEKKLITFHDPSSWHYSGNGIVVPITLVDGIPYTEASISVQGKEGIPAHMLLDFGAAETMTLTSPFVKANDLINLAATNASVNHMAGLENQWFTQTNVRGRISRLSMGSLVVDSFPVNMSVNTKGAYASSSFAGTIGEGIYQRYHSFLDYARHRIIFEPTPDAAKPYAERMSYGMTLVASGDDLHTYTVAGIRADFPADKDGFKKGDIIAELDGKSSSEFTLGELRAALANDGRHHSVKVKRDSSEVVIPFDVRRLSIDRK